MGTAFRTGVNDLATMRPELVEEWHSKNTFSPSDVAYSSGRSAWWLCKTCGHEWFCAVYSRGSHGTGCLMCARRKHKAKFAVK